MAEHYVEGPGAGEYWSAFEPGDESDLGPANFHELPVEEQVEQASAIVLIEYERTPEKLRAVVAEILKLEPGTEFHYEVGDEIQSFSRRPQEGTEYGDGLVMFFVGRHALSRYGTSVYDGRMRGIGDMPLARLRELIASQG